jgi:hypothetical protein
VIFDSIGYFKIWSWFVSFIEFMFRTTVLTFWGLVWIFLFPFQTVAQIKDSTKAADRKIKTRIFAVPTLGSGPETGFYFGAVSLFDFFSKNDTLSRH